MCVIEHRVQDVRKERGSRDKEESQINANGKDHALPPFRPRKLKQVTLVPHII